MASNNLIIVDDEYVQAANEIVRYGNDLKMIIDEYVTIMEYINTVAIKDREINFSIQSLLIVVGKISASLQDTTGELYRNMDNFIGEIDMADDFIY